MQKANPKKTKSEHKVPFKLRIFGVVVLGLVFMAAVQAYEASRHHTQFDRTLTAGRQTYRLEVVSTPENMQKGLSGRRGLLSGTGMLFDNPDVAERCMWMKDMEFSIDILWLDENNRVVRTASDVSPESYPRTYCAEARYVIELKAGEIGRSGIQRGQQLAVE